MSKTNQLVSCRTSAIGLTLRPNTTYEEWWKDGLSLAERIKSDLWAIGDWLREGECNGFIANGKLKDACAIFDMAYGTLSNAASVCRKIESSRRRETLPFSYHTEVANRQDADELLDWCEENDATRNQLRKEKKARDEKALENGEILETDDEVEDDASFDFGGDDEPEAEPEEELEEEDPIQANMDATSKDLRAWAAETSSLFKRIPKTPWLNETVLNIIQNHLKSAGSSARTQVGKDKCPKCEDGCTYCRDTGWMPKYELEMYS